MTRVSLGTARIVIVVALVAVGVVVLSNGFDDPGEAVAESPSPSSATGPTGATTGPSPSPPATLAPQAPEDISFAVFNGTEAAGLAADAADFLTGEGYALTQDPADAPSTGVSRTTVYFRGGTEKAQNKANAAAVVQALGAGKPRQLSTEVEGLVTDRTDIVVVLGSDYDFKT
jgi:hypothetical protein